MTIGGPEAGSRLGSSGASPRVGIITQARSTSTRLPGKVLLPVAGRSLLDHHLDRLAVSGLPVFVATTVNDTDDPIAALARGRGLEAWRGSEDDVLSRFAGCAAAYDLEVVVRVTSDCPLIDGTLIADAVARFVSAGDPWLYLSNTLERSYPRGFDFEVFSGEALADAASAASSPAEREHVTPYLYANGSGRMRFESLTWAEDKSAYRVTLDTEDDLRLITALIEEHGADRMTVAEIIALLDAHPELAAVNAHVEQKKLGQ